MLHAACSCQAGQNPTSSRLCRVCGETRELRPLDSVLITGAATGLGLEMAVYLAERGFQVYATIQDLSQREALDAEAARRDVHLDVLRLDVNDQASIDEAVDTILQQAGGIYGLVNNAGMGMRGYFEDVSDAEVREVYETNVFGTMAVTRAVLPHMRAGHRGRIVVVSSVGGLIGSLGNGVYCSTKFALEGFGESLAQEVLPFGIYVTLVEPGVTMTPIFTVHRRRARRALDTSSPYYDWFMREEELVDAVARTSGIVPADVAKTVHRALTAKRPRLRYVVGWRASLLVTLRRYLPGELFERLYFGEVMRRVTKAQPPEEVAKR